MSMLHPPRATSPDQHGDATTYPSPATITIERTIVIKYTETYTPPPPTQTQISESRKIPSSSKAGDSQSMKLELKFREKLADLRNKFPDWNIEGWGKTSNNQQQPSPKMDDLSPRPRRNDDDDGDADDYQGHRFPAPPTQRPTLHPNYSYADPNLSIPNITTTPTTLHCSMKVLQSVNNFIDEHLSAVPISGRERYKEITPDSSTPSPSAAPLQRQQNQIGGNTTHPARYFDASTPAGAQLQNTLALLQQHGTIPTSTAFPPQSKFCCPNCGFGSPVNNNNSTEKVAAALHPATYLEIDSDTQQQQHGVGRIASSSSSSSSAASSVGNVRGQQLKCAVPGLVCRVSDEHDPSPPPVKKLLYCDNVGVVTKVSGARVKVQFFEDGVGADVGKKLGSKTWWYHRTELVLLALSLDKYDANSNNTLPMIENKEQYRVSHTAKVFTTNDRRGSTTANNHSPSIEIQPPRRQSTTTEPTIPSPVKTTPVTATASVYSPCSIGEAGGGGVGGGFSPELYRAGSTEQQNQQFDPSPSTSPPALFQFPPQTQHQQQRITPMPAVMFMSGAAMDESDAPPFDSVRDRYNNTPAYKDSIATHLPQQQQHPQPSKQHTHHYLRTEASDDEDSDEDHMTLPGGDVASPLSPFPQLAMIGLAGTARSSAEPHHKQTQNHKYVPTGDGSKGDGILAVESPTRGGVAGYDIVSVGTSMMDSIEEINVLDHVDDDARPPTNDDDPDDPFRHVVMGASTPRSIGTPRSNGFLSSVSHHPMGMGLGHSGRSMSITTAVADGLVVGGSAARSLRHQLRASSVVYDAVSEGGGGGVFGGGGGVSPSSNRENSFSYENSRRSPQPAWI